MSSVLLLFIATTVALADGVTYDPVSGSCATFNDHVQNRGLRDAEGDTHLNTLGWTSCRFKATLPDKGVKVRQLIVDRRRCLFTDIRKARFSANQSVIVMRWDHGRPTLAPACRAELEKVERAILDHESNHVNDCKAIVADASAAWKKSRHRIKVCGDIGPGAPDLDARLKTAIEDGLKDELARMNREMEYRTRTTHERIGYGSSGIDCRRCRD